MLFLNQLKPMTLNNNKVIGLPKLKNKLKGSMIFLLTPSLESSIRTINSKTLYNTNHNSYYIEWMYNLKLLNKTIREKVDVKDILTTVKDQCPTITRGTKLFSSYAGNNVFVDLHKYNEFYFTETDYSVKNDLEQYYKLLMGIIDDETFASYESKIIIIPVNDWLTDVKDTKNFKYTNANNPVQFIYQWFLDKDMSAKPKKDVQIVFIADNNMSFMLNPSTLIKDQHSTFKTLIARLSGDKKALDATSAPVTTDAQSQSDKNKEITQSIIDAAETNSQSFTGEKGISDTTKEKIAQVVDASKDDKSAVDTVNNDKEIKLEIAKQLAEKEGKSYASNRRDEILRAKRLEIKIGNKTLDEIVASSEFVPMKKVEIPIDSINPEIRELSFPAFEAQYNEKLLEKHIVGMFDAFSKTQGNPMHIIEVNKEDTSDTFNRKETWTVKYEDEDRNRHTIKLDVPVFVDDKYLYIGGNKKSIIKQLFIPIAKTGPDRVQIATNYQKAFIMLSGANISPKNQKIKKLMSSYVGTAIRVRTGDSTISNNKYKMTLEYSDLAKSIVQIDTDKYTIYLSQANFRKWLDDNRVTYEKDDTHAIPIAFDKQEKKVIMLNTDKDIVEGTTLSIADFIINEIKRVDAEAYNKMQTSSLPKKYLFSKIKIMDKEIPVIILLGYFIGLAKALDVAGIKYEFHDGKPRMSDEEKDSTGLIEFADGYMTYERYPIENAIIVNGLLQAPTKLYTFTEFQEKEVYLDLFETMLSKRNIAYALDNFNDLFMTDPITQETFAHYNLPTNFPEVCVYASALLADMSYIRSNDISVCRLRSNEIVPVFIYKAIADAYDSYTIAKKNGAKIPFSVRQDQVIRDILTQKIVEDYSSLNPILEVEKSMAVTFKGPNGLNMDRAYTIEKRAFDDSMLGIIGMSTVPSGSVGVVRHLTADSSVVSPMGYLDIKKDANQYPYTSIFTPAELLTPMAVMHDDSPRTAMTSTQAKHTIATKVSSPVLVRYGMEKALPYIISNDFVYKAKKDGEVVELDEEAGIMVLKYKDGTIDAVNIGTRISKNGGGGFFISNQLTPEVKVGDKVKTNDIVAMNKQFFSHDTLDGAPTYNTGTMANVAVVLGDFSHEDSTAVTSQLSEDMSSEVVMKKEYVIGPNSNVSYIAEKGQKIKVGDPILVFNHSFDDPDINKFLKSLDDDMEAEVLELGTVPIKSKYSGTIEDVVIYYTIDEDLLSPSLQTLIKKYNAKLMKSKNLYKKHDKNYYMLDDKPTEKITPVNGKIKGIEVGEGVLVEFYIKYKLKLGVGDKITFYTALKSIVQTVIPEGQEPYPVTNPDKRIDAFLSPISIDARMTASIKIAMGLNKLLIGLSDKCKEIMK